MADLDERLNRLISDQESIKKVLEMAQAILAQRECTVPEPATPQPVPFSESETSGDASAHNLSSMLSALFPQQATSEPHASQPSENGVQNATMSPIASVLPLLLSALSGQSSLIKNERVELLRAMRPYLKENRLDSIDRALKMANMTKAATSAIHMLGR